MLQSLELMDGPFDAEDSFTLAVIRNSGRIALGRKTRGYGQGKLVLPGGKNRHYLSSAGLSLTPEVDNVAREVREELGINIDLKTFSHVANLHVATQEDTKDISVFETTCTQTALANSSELEDVQWQEENALPYGELPDDYALWLPHVLKGYAVTAYLETENDRIFQSTVFRQALKPPGRMEMVQS